MSQASIEAMLHFCGLLPGEEALLPTYLTTLGQARLTKRDKEHVIAATITKNPKYRSVKVPLTSSMLGVIRERNWTGGETVCTFANCMKGLSIFAMKPLSDEALSEINIKQEALAKATATSPEDHLHNMQKPSVPESVEGLEKYVKRFVNILYPITVASELCLDMQHIVSCLEQWSDTARAAMSQLMIASIMWVILKESRRFYLNISTAKLPAFKQMLIALETEQVFVVMDLPAALIARENKRRSAGDQGAGNTGHPNKGEHEDKRKRDDKEREIKVNKLITQRCEQMMQIIQEKKLTLKAVCQLCNATVSATFPKGCCGQVMFFGKCFNHRCNLQHRALTDEEAKAVLVKLKKVVESPALLQG